MKGAEILSLVLSRQSAAILAATVLLNSQANAENLDLNLDLSDLKLPTMYADYQSSDVDMDTEKGGGGDNYNPRCAELRADLNADLGEVLRAGCEPTLGQMSALMDNPVGNVAMLFNQFDTYGLENPENKESENKHNYMLLAQFPKRLSENWNLINRVLVNYTSLPIEQNDIDEFDDIDFGNLPGAPLPPPSDTFVPVDLFDGRTTALGDAYYVGLLSPNTPMELDNGAKLLLGAGFDIGFPTAAEDLTGTGKWTAGPAALGVYMGKKLKAGALVTHYKDFAGDGDRNDVNMTNIQTLYYWSINETTSIGAGPNVIANWEQDNDNTWTVPIGIGINKTFQIGKVPVRFGVEYHYSVIQPDDVVSSNWDLRFYIIPAVPSALFSWMQ